MELPELSSKNAYLFFLLVLPGFIAQTVYDLFIPHGERDASSNFFLGLAYGTVNFGLTWPLTFWAVSALSQNGVLIEVLAYAALLFSLVVFPALIGLATYRLRNSSLLSKWGFLGPHPTSWDGFFAKRETCWIIFALKNGDRIGGYYGLGSRASSFPNEPDVYLSEVWKIDEDGRFKERIDGTMGMLIRRDDCELIEFLREVE